MAPELSFVGKRLPAKNAELKATGQAKYPVDMRLPGMLVGKMLGSPHAHAAIKAIDKSVAERLPGVEAVITFADVPHVKINSSIQKWLHHHPGLDIEDQYVLADKARFVGDPIAAVAAIDEATAFKALELLEIEYEVLPAVTDVFGAMEPGAPQVHDFAQGNVSQVFGFPGNRGDAKVALSESAVVVERTFSTSRQNMLQLEPASCLASFDATGELTVWIANQRPLQARKQLAEIFSMPENKINVVCEFGGGFFGEHYWPHIPIAVALAQKAHKPVRIELTREETIRNNPYREVYVETGKLGFSKDGTLLVGQDRIIVDSGAYFVRSNATGVVSMAAFSSLYRFPVVDAELKAVYSNIPPAGGSRGYGEHEALVLLEALMDDAAEKLGMDPLELRLKNLKHMGEWGLMFPMETDTQERVILTGAEKFRWSEKRSRDKGSGARRVGVGMATYFDTTGGQPIEIMDRHIMMSLDEDGTVTVTTNHPDGGMNLLGTCSQIAAEVSGLRPEDFRYVHGETKGALFDWGMGANSGLYTAGNLTIKAATELKKQILEAAAARLDVPVDGLDIRDAFIHVLRDPAKSLTVRQLADTSMYSHAGPTRNIFVKESFSPTQNPNSTGVVFADVEVDAETGEVKPQKLLIVHDCGRAINPMTVEGQLQGGMAQGVGYALFEELQIDSQSGALETANLNTYKIPSTLDLPELEVHIFEEPTPSGPFGGKSVGMSGVLGVPAAIGNAIYDAVGVRIEQMPWTAERVLEALKAQREAKQV